MMTTRQTTIDVVICDKNPLVQSGLTHILSQDDRFNLVATAADGERFIEATKRLTFHVGIVGWDMPYLDGRGVLQKLREEQDPPKVIIYTGNPAPDVPRQVMQLGGAGFCSKSDSPQRLIEAVVAAYEGRMVFPFMDLKDRQDDPLATLTMREHELLMALIDGRTNAQIAGDLEISLNTVKFHLKNLYGKMDVNNRAQAVARYLKAAV